MHSPEEGPASWVLHFDGFELDARLFELRRRGQRVEVQPKVLHLLFYLARHRDRSVSSKELLATLWAGETVGDASLRRAVAGARRALGTRANPILQTVRGRGYRFVAAVELQAEPHTQPHAQPHASARQTPQLTALAGERAFIGRKRVVWALAGSLSQSMSGGGHIVLLSGEPGIGKSRLLSQVENMAKERQVQVWSGRCMEFAGAPALWPVIQILRCAAEQLSGEQLLELMGPSAPDIVAAMPELSQKVNVDQSAPDLSASRARFRFFDGLTRFLGRAALTRPLLLVFDDLQRADASTMRLLGFMAQQLAGTRILVVAAFRPEPTASRFAELLHDIVAEGSTRHIQLLGLNRREVAAYLRSAVRRGRPTPHLVDRLIEHTGGNPLFLEHLLATLSQDGSVQLELAERMRWMQVRGLAAAIAAHLQRLPAHCRRLLQVAAIFGREFEMDGLASVLSCERAALQRELVPALAAGLVQGDPLTGRSLRFAHMLIRDALYDELQPAERAGLHYRLGSLLEARGATAEAELSELAAHFALSVPHCAPDRALTYSVRAGRAALQRLAHDEAVAHFEKALALLQAGPPNPELKAALALDRGQALVELLETSAARAALLETAEDAEARGASEPLIRAAVLLGRIPESGTVDSDQVELIERALRHVAPADPRRVYLQALHAKSLVYAPDPLPCVQIARAALSEIQTNPQGEAYAETLLACLAALTGPEHLSERAEIGAALDRLGREPGHRRLLASAASARIWVGLEQGDTRPLRPGIRSLETIARQTRDQFARWLALVYRGMGAFMGGRLEQAATLAGAALQAGQSFGEAGAYHVYCAQMSAVLKLQGRLRAAENLVRQVAVRHPGIAGWQAALALLEAENGSPQHAQQVLARLVEADPMRLRNGPFALGTLSALSNLCAEVGDASTAQALYAVILPYEQRHGVVSIGVTSHGPMALQLGRLSLRAGEVDRALRHFKVALTAAERLGSPVFTGGVCLAMAHALLIGEGGAAREPAGALLERAFGLAQRYTLPRLLHLCTALSAATGLALRGQVRYLGI